MHSSCDSGFVAHRISEEMWFLKTVESWLFVALNSSFLILPSEYELEIKKYSFVHIHSSYMGDLVNVFT